MGNRVEVCAGGVCCPHLSLGELAVAVLIPLLEHRLAVVLRKGAAGKRVRVS